MEVFRDNTIGMPRVRHTASVATNLNGSQIAELFFCCDDEQMADFFNRVGKLALESGACFPVQLEYVSQNPALTARGRNAMALIGDYAHHNDG